jgi:cytoskeleton protein RodZ
MSDSGVNDQPVSNEPEDRLPKMLPGARLAALRQELGWTVEQVAGQLNLAPRQILAIERDDYPALPGIAIVRGFVRAYAKLLKVDAAPLLADIGGETVLAHESLAPQKSLSTPFADSRMPSMTERPGISSKWVLGALLAVLSGVGLWAARQGGEPIPPAATSAIKEGVAGMSGADENKPSTDIKSEANITLPAESSAPAAVVPEVRQQQALTQAPATPAATPTQSVAHEASAAPGKDALHLKVREESWIEIRRSRDNSVLLSRIVKPGESETIELTEPVSIVFGNAAGVDATLRGSPLELKANSKSNVARLTLK